MQRGFDRRQFLGVALATGAGLVVDASDVAIAADCAAGPIGAPATAASHQPGRILVGFATADITPSKPVALWGQFYLRIAETADTPITASVIALDSQNGEQSGDVAIFVSCDVCGIPPDTVEMIRHAVHARLPELDPRKIIVSATHTHTAPVLDDRWYQIPKSGVMQTAEYRKLFADRVVAAIEQAWNSRHPGSVTWGLGHAVVGRNRRVTYADGHAAMYGETNQTDFRGLEGCEDHDIGTLFFWNDSGSLIAIAIEVACPSQEVEKNANINADFWHPLRESLRKRYGSELCVLGWTSAAGDQASHLVHNGRAEERMRSLRQLSRMEELARRIEAAVVDVYEVVKNDGHSVLPFAHKVVTASLPMRLVTEKEYDNARKLRRRCLEEIAGDRNAADRWAYANAAWHEDVIERFEKQKTNPQPMFVTEIHVVRVGDVAICSNPFELFAEYGLRIKARSKAIQTFLIELTGLPGVYLPTDRAVRAGGYSAVVESDTISPEGGQMLVDATVDAISSLWAEK